MLTVVRHPLQTNAKKRKEMYIYIYINIMDGQFAHVIDLTHKHINSIIETIVLRRKQIEAATAE